MNATIEASQKANKIRGDKSTVNRNKPFASVNYTKMISILVLKSQLYDMTARHANVQVSQESEPSPLTEELDQGFYPWAGF